ncbi:MAG: T9SS type A sorting domain-containing protein, partial [Ignavibacteria bacterium]|nr:T9SS type A sorting domain-containing protein [Ignavibacteria bacterium]
IIIIKEINSNSVYYPAVGIYSLQTLKSGNAYLIKCTDALQLQFPACKSLKLVQGGNERAEITATATTHIVAFAANVLNVFAPGDKLIAYNQSQLPVGEITISDPNLAAAVALYGNDSLSSSIDGLLQGELVTWKLLELASSMYYDVDATYDLFMPNQGNYAPDGLSYVTNITVNPTGIAEKVPILKVYPNPASKSLFITYKGLQIIELELIGSNGKKLLQLEPKNEQIVDISSLPKGVYFLRAVSSQGVVVEKVIKNMD